MSDWPLVVEKDDGIRPAGSPDECFYCRQKIGNPHQKDCVIVEKIVEIEFKLRLPVKVPHHWTKENIEFRYGESSWCADNLVEMIEKYAEKNGCCCSVCTSELIKTIDDTPTREIRKEKK